jgi:hypothetical protein
VLKVAMPRPSLDAVSRGDDRPRPSWPFDDEAENASFKPLTRAEAELFRQRHPALSPWRVIAAQLVASADDDPPVVDPPALTTPAAPGEGVPNGPNGELGPTTPPPPPNPAEATNPVINP